jgi:hypothetical protein
MMLPAFRVSDPHRFNVDPDPAFFLIADPDSGSRSRIRIQGMKKFIAGYFISIFLIKNYNFLIPRPP